MLKEIEQHVGTLIAGAGTGTGSVTVALRSLAMENAFHHEQHALVEDPLGRRRVLPVSFTLRVAVRIKPAADDAQAIRTAREALLEHVARIAHILGPRRVRTGESFGGADAGFAVQSFVLTKATIGETLVDDAVSAELRYRGTATIWPPDGQPQPIERITRIDATIDPVTP